MAGVVIIFHRLSGACIGEDHTLISARMQPVARELDLAVRADLAPAMRSQLVADVARADIDQIDRENDAAVGTDVKYRTFVDGSPSTRLEAVNPDHGIIAAVWDLGTDVVSIIGAMLRQHSPVMTGRYRASHILLADGVDVKSVDPKLSVSEYTWISSVPYARKIERRQADGVYESVAALARQRFGNTAKISFSFRSLASGGGTALDVWAKGSRGGSRNEARRGDWLRRQPAIIIVMR